MARKINRSVTHGGRAKRFTWFLNGNDLKIENEDGRKHIYSVEEIFAILSSIENQFGEEWFPLANNVTKMHDGSEIAGLGTAIYQLRPGDVTHAQGSSYLGVVLEDVGILEWNGKARWISWRITAPPADLEELVTQLNASAKPS